jgi:NADPH:quinone reductase-like Zn-dependent oxidoreductase
LFSRGDLQAGETVLCLGTGGVSIFALQLAKAANARVIITSSSDEKLARARELGAAEIVNYQTYPDWEKEVWRLTEKQGVDHVVEVGGSGTLEKSMACVAAGGHIAMIGVLTGFGPPTSGLFPLMTRNARLDGIYAGSRRDFEALNAFLETHNLHPIIDKVFPFAQARDAFALMASGQHFGKIVVTLGA